MRTIFLPLLLFGALIAGEIQQKTAEQTIDITIDYGQERAARTVAAPYANGMTALSVLRRVADVRTKKAGAFTFITAIDGIRSAPQKMGWFYSIDGKNADKTASTFLLENAHSMRWEYRPDNCLGR